MNVSLLYILLNTTIIQNNILINNSDNKPNRSSQDVTDTHLPCHPWYPCLPWSRGSRLLPGRRIKETEGGEDVTKVNEWHNTDAETIWEAFTHTHTLKDEHTQMLSLGKIPCCHRNSWSSFFFLFFFFASVPAKVRIQDFIEIIISIMDQVSPP